MPYYSMAAHAANDPPPATIRDDAALLRLLSGDVQGLVISGKGGIGKTRLAFELAREAQRNAWLVMTVQPTMPADSVRQLAGALRREHPVLLLIDYAETLDEFDAIVDMIDQVNDVHGHRLRWIASCRTSYYPMLHDGTRRHEHIDATPVDREEDAWYTRYRTAAVRWILEQSGITPTDAHLRICGDLPIFAVMLLYLRERRGGEDDLRELLHEREFGNWIAKRVRSRVGNSNRFERNTAILMSILPLAGSAATAIDGEYGEIRDWLANDGWAVEHTGRLEVAHDMFTDRVVLAYAEKVRHSVDAFVSELLTVAERHDAIASALLTLQRVADQPLFARVDWRALIDRHLTANPAWYHARTYVIRSPLLSPAARAAILDHHEEFWRKSVGEAMFQSTLSWTARHARDDQETLGKLKRWLAAAIAAGPAVDALLSVGVREQVPGALVAARAWLDDPKHNTYAASFLLTAILDAVRDSAADQHRVIAWLEKYARHREADYVLRSWLDAHPDVGTVEQYLLTYLKAHEHASSDAFDYPVNAWLGARGDPGLVLPYLTRLVDDRCITEGASYLLWHWLRATDDVERAEQVGSEYLRSYDHEAADYVFRAWISRGLDLSLIAELLGAWLDKHGTRLCARNVYIEWLHATGDWAAIESDVVAWLEAQRGNELSRRLLCAWLDHDAPLESVRRHVVQWLADFGTTAEAKALYRAWIARGGDVATLEPALWKWFATESNIREEATGYFLTFLVEAPLDPEALQPAVVAWATHHAETSPHVHSLLYTWLLGTRRWLAIASALDAHVAKFTATHRGVSYALGAWLENGGDPAAIRAHVLAWLRQYGRISGAGDLLALWLVVRPDDSEIAPLAASWLLLNSRTDRVRSVLQLWLSHGGADAERHLKTAIGERLESLSVANLLAHWIACGVAPALGQKLSEDWLARHPTRTPARVLLCAWLDSGKDRRWAERYIGSWLAARGDEAQAALLLRSWLRAGVALHVAEPAVRRWLRVQPDDPQVPLLIDAWAERGGDPNAFRQTVA
ncbi:MAG TPA: hypothetical protein VF824_02855 [Thermoanaerobaculia bacterium]